MSLSSPYDGSSRLHLRRGQDGRTSLLRMLGSSKEAGHYGEEKEPLATAAVKGVKNLSVLSRCYFREL